MKRKAKGEHPILFSGEMVQAILGDRKSQTRRVVKRQKVYEEILRVSATAPTGFAWSNGWNETCPYGRVGDVLWVRHSWWHRGALPCNPGNEQAWDEWTRIARWPSGEEVRDCVPELNDWKHRPSIFMPRWACRIWLEITDVRVQRVQEISEDDARAEGIRQNDLGQWLPSYPSAAGWVDPRRAYESLWDSINAKRGYSWESNPWVFAITFRRVK